jgi:hypothetical protein
VYTPCTFWSRDGCRLKVVDDEFKLYWQRVQCRLGCSNSVQDLDLARGCPICDSTLLYYSDSSISGVRFVRVIFEGIYSLIFLVPVNTFARNCSQSLAIVRCYVYRLSCPITNSNSHWIFQRRSFWHETREHSNRSVSSWSKPSKHRFRDYLPYPGVHHNQLDHWHHSRHSRSPGIRQSLPISARCDNLKS